MNVFNRVMATLLCLAVIALSVLFLLAPYDAIDTVQYNLGVLRESVGGGLWGVWIAIAALLGVLGVLVIVLEFIPRQHKTIRIWAQGRGDARLRVTSVAQTLEYRIDQMDGVRKVVPYLVSHGSDLSVKLEVDSSPSANIPALSDQIIDHAIRILEGELGLKVKGKVQLDITHEPFVAPPVPAEAPAPAVGGARPYEEPAREPEAPTPPPPAPEVVAEEKEPVSAAAVGEIEPPQAAVPEQPLDEERAIEEETPSPMDLSYVVEDQAAEEAKAEEKQSDEEEESNEPSDETTW